MQNRILWADQVKALAIILMVVCHYGLAKSECVKFIYIFHMPIFFFISGYFDKATTFNMEILKKNFKTLMIPYFFFSICAFSICWISPYLHPELYYHDGIAKTFMKAFFGMFLMEDISRPYAFMPLGPLWFLVALFEVKIFFASLIAALQRRLVNVIALLLIMTIFIICAYFKLFSTDACLMSLPIYIVGYISKRYNFIEMISNRFVSVLLFLVGLSYLLFIGMQNGKISMDGVDFGNSVRMFYINAIIGSLTFIFMFKSLDIKWKWLSVVGASTLTILGTHAYLGIISKVLGVGLLNINPREEPLWYVISTTFIGITIGVYCHQLIIKRIPFVLGK